MGYAKMLAEHYGVPMVSIGALLKEESESGSALGQEVAKGQKNNRPLHDDLVLAVLQERLQQADVADGFILEGGPRNENQARGIDAILLQAQVAFAGVVMVQFDYDTYMEEMTGQRRCRKCGAQFNIYNNPPNVDTVCDYCGGRLHSRVDDREEKISRRLRDYEVIRDPLAAYYQGRFKEVEGAFDTAVMERAIRQLAEELRAAAPQTRVSSVSKRDRGEGVVKKKSASKKGAVKKAAAKKSAPKKAAVKKAAVKKSVPKKAAVKKAAAKKSVPKKAAVKKTVAKKSAPKKAAVKKAK